MVKKKTAIYIRVSVLKEDAVSPQMQLDKAESYCKLQDEEYEVYQDLDFSGKDTNRPAFQRMYRKIKMGFISKLVVYRLDRLSRSLKDLALFMDFLHEKGVEFYSITEHFDTSTPMGRAMFSIMGVFAQMEREVISERIADTKAKQMADGIKLGPAPYGYRLKVKSHSQWEIIPEEAKVIRKVFELYASGKYSYVSLAAYMHRTIGRSPREKGAGMVPWGVSGCARQGWQPWTVRCIVANPTYAGVIRNSPEVKAKNYRAIVSRTLFARCERIRQKRDPYLSGYHHATISGYPLKGKIFCRCGFSLYARRYIDPHMPAKLYYWCRNIRHNEKRPLIAVSIVLDDILGYLKTCRLDPELISDARRKLQRREDKSSQQAQLLRHLQGSYQRLQERYIDGGIAKSFMERKSGEIKAKIADAQTDMRYYPKSRILDDIPVIIARLKQHSSAESCYCISEALDIFIDKVVWGKEGIKEVRIYDEYKGFFPGVYKPKRRVSVQKLARACSNPGITAEILRRWNREGIIHDIGRISGKKMYNLKESLRRIAITERMMARGYTLWQIRDFLDGKPLLGTVVPISREMNMLEHIVRKRLRKLLKPALIYGETRIYCYRLDEAKKALSQSEDAP